MPTIKVEDVQNVEVRTGEEVTLEVPSANTTGYLWQLDANPAVEIIGHEVIADEKNFGGAGIERFVVKPIREGEATLRLALKAPWENEAAETHDIHVHSIGSEE